MIADCARLLDAPLQSFREFTGEYVDIIEALPASSNTPPARSIWAVSRWTWTSTTTC